MGRTKMITYNADNSKTFSGNVVGKFFSMFVPSFVIDRGKNKQSEHYYWDEKAQRISVPSGGDIGDVTVSENDAHNLKTLHVEDNAEIRSIVGYYLRKKFDIKFAQNGSNAVSAVEKEHYDVIIMDINLGDGIDGIETAKQIRAKVGYENVPIIAVTANLSANVRENCIEAGMDAFLPKPFQKDDLINTIIFVLQKKGMRVSAA